MPSSSTAVRNTVLWMLKVGLKPVPLHPQSKAAVSRNYVSPGYKPPDPVFWEVNNYGVGSVLGPRFGGCVDCDIDALDIVDICDRFFPDTNAIFGRQSKPRSHRVYLIENNEEFPSIEFRDPITKKMVLELRGDGRESANQTVFPGSLHQDTGEMVEWSNGAEPVVIAVVKKEDLIRAARMAFIAYLLRRHVWLEGQRNVVTTYLSGMLFKLGWNYDDAYELLTVAAAEPLERGFERSLRGTWDKFNKGLTVAGSAKLLELGIAEPVIGAIRKVARIADAEDIDVVEEYNERFAVTAVGGSFIIADISVPGEQPIFFKKDAFTNLHGNEYAQVTNVDGKQVSKPKPKIWLASPQRRQYDSVDFLPGEGVDFLAGGRKVLNLWSGWAVPSVEGDCSGWLELLYDVICGRDNELYWWMLHWFAHILRDPQTKPMTAPVVIGIEGAGKTLLFHYFGKILGSAFFPTSRDHLIHGKFTGHLGSVLLLHSDEALSPNDKRHAGTVRSLLSDPFQAIEPKGIDSVRVRSFIRLSFTSNDPQAVQAVAGDRRFTIANGEKRKLSDDLKNRILTEMHGQGPAALRHYLENMPDYDPQLPLTNIKNEASRSLKTMNLDPYGEWWYLTLCDGVLLPDYMRVLGKPDDDLWPGIVSLKALAASCQIHQRQSGMRKPFNYEIFKSRLSTMIGVRFIFGRRWFPNDLGDDVPLEAKNLGTRQPTLENLPDLKSCQKAFAEFLGQEVEWPEDSEGAPPAVKDAVKF